MRSKLLCLAAATAVISAMFVAPAQANHSWGGYHWARTANPFTLKLGDNVTSVWDPILQTTSSDWSQSTVLDTTIVAGGARSKRCAATTGRVEVCNSTYGNNGWLGIASIWLNGSHITAGTTKLNDTYFNTATYNTTAWRNLVSCQEVGHTFGLDHQDENFDNPNLGTCMDYTRDPSTNQHPNSHDYEELGIIYQHLDSFSTVDQSAAVPTGTVGDTPASWGKLAHSDNGISWYVRDLGNNNQIITEVFWVPGYAH
jgi:hypothetical protein